MGPPNLAGTAALRASNSIGPGFRPVAATDGARLLAADGEFFLRAEDRLREVKLELHLQIDTPDGTIGTAATEERVENIAEAPEVEPSKPALNSALPKRS